MVWKDGKYHITDNYFSMINVKGINHMNKHHAKCPDVPSDIRLISNDPDFTVPEPDGNMEYRSDSERSYMSVVAGDDTYKPEEDEQPAS